MGSVITCGRRNHLTNLGCITLGKLFRCLLTFIFPGDLPLQQISERGELFKLATASIKTGIYPTHLPPTAQQKTERLVGICFSEPHSQHHFSLLYGSTALHLQHNCNQGGRHSSNKFSSCSTIMHLNHFAGRITSNTASLPLFSCRYDILNTP